MTTGSLRAPIVQERLIPASPKEVFAAWSDPDRLSAWMCPSEGMRPASVELDFRVGGRFSIVMHGEQGDYGQSGEYLEINPPKRLVFLWVSDFVPQGEAQTRVTVSLEPAPGGTRLRLVHDELQDTGTYDGHEGGWSRILDLMSKHWEA